MESEPFPVQGVAIRPGISKNGILYTINELEEFTPTLKGKPILKDHSGKTDDTIGLVTKSESKGNGIPNYYGWIKDEKTIEKINDGRIKEVSIGAFAKRLVKPKDDESGEMFPSMEHPWKAVGIEAMELSTTPIPAVKGTSIQKAIESFKLTGKYLPIVEDFNQVSNMEVELPKDILEKYLYLLKEDISQKTEETKMVEDASKPVETPAVQEAVKPASVQTEKSTVQEAKVKIEIDSSQIDELIKKQEKALEMKAKLNEPIKQVAETKKVDNSKGKIIREDTAIQNEKSGQYVVEGSEFGHGFSLWKQPKADGKLI